MADNKPKVDIVGNKNVIRKRSNRVDSRWKHFIPNFTTTFLITFFIVSLLMNGDIKPFTKRGFFCNDSTIKYPFRKETIDLKMLIVLGLVIPGLVIKLCDNILINLLKSSISHKNNSLNFSQRRRKISDDVVELALEDDDRINTSDNKKVSVRRLLSRDTDVGSLELTDSIKNYSDVEDEIEDEDVTLFTRVPLDSDDEQLKSRTINKRPTRAFGEFQQFFFGLSTTMLLTGIGKITLGNLRPHFYQRCMPSVDCSISLNANKYIENFTCTNSDLKPRDLSYISTSWPSGHSAVMFYSMLYLAFHLNTVIPEIVHLSSTKVKQRFDPLILYAVYVLIFGLACFIAITRISDYHHHVLDVISGSVIGSLIAIALTKALPKQYLRESDQLDYTDN